MLDKKLTHFCFPLQIILMISQTMWCRNITECLTTEGDRLEAMKGAEQSSFQVSHAAFRVLTLQSSYCHEKS